MSPGTYVVGKEQGEDIKVTLGALKTVITGEHFYSWYMSISFELGEHSYHIPNMLIATLDDPQGAYYSTYYIQIDNIDLPIQQQIPGEFTHTLRKIRRFNSNGVIEIFDIADVGYTLDDRTPCRIFAFWVALDDGSWQGGYFGETLKFSALRFAIPTINIPTDFICNWYRAPFNISGMFEEKNLSASASAHRYEEYTKVEDGVLWYVHACFIDYVVTYGEQSFDIINIEGVGQRSSEGFDADNDVKKIQNYDMYICPQIGIGYPGYMMTEYNGVLLGLIQVIPETGELYYLTQEEVARLTPVQCVKVSVLPRFLYYSPTGVDSFVCFGEEEVGINLYGNIGGSWIKANKVFANDGGVWKESVKLFGKKDGWK